MRNLIDMAVAAAFIQEKDYYQQANWDLGVFADEGQFPVETYETPRQVESTLNVIWKGNTVMMPIGGGVHVEPLQALKSENVLADEEGKVRRRIRQSLAEGSARRPVVVGLAPAWASSIRSTSTTRTSQTFVWVGPVFEESSERLEEAVRVVAPQVVVQRPGRARAPR